MRLAGKDFQDLKRSLIRAGFSNHHIVDKNACVAADHNVVGVLLMNEGRLFARKISGDLTERQILGNAFVHVGGLNFKAGRNQPQQFFSSGGIGGEYHKNHSLLLCLYHTIFYRICKE